jgi:acetylornithine deacetylase
MVKFNHWLDEHNPQIVEFLKDYISYPSTQGNEKAVQEEFLVPFLGKEMHWDHTETVYADPEKARPNINNIWLGKGKGRRLLINGHSDVVVIPPEQLEKWRTDPWQAVVSDGKVYGRGAADMKGPNTAAIWAIKAIMDLGIRLEGDLLLGLVIGEETCEQKLGVIPSTEKFLEEGISPIDFCLNVEPTGLEIYTASTGNFDFSVYIKGKECHTSMKGLVDYPQRYGLPSGAAVGVDAAQVAAEVLRRLKQLEHRWNMIYGHPVLGGGGWPIPIDQQGTGNTALACTVVRAGSYIGSLAGNATIEGQIHYPPNADVKILQQEFSKVVKGVMLSFAGLEDDSIKIEFCRRWDWGPFETTRDHKACQTLSSVMENMGMQPVFSGMKSVVDNAYIQEMGIPTVSCGPGRLADGAHGPNEHIAIEEILQAIKLYVGFFIDWCGQAT